MYHPLAEERLYDSRSGAASRYGHGGGSLIGGALRALQLTGDLIPAGAVAVCLKVELVNPHRGGWLNIGPLETLPRNVSIGGAFAAPPLHPAYLICPLSADGRAFLFSSVDADFDLDVNGYFS
jgi:hypothetical protein